MLRSRSATKVAEPHAVPSSSTPTKRNPEAPEIGNVHYSKRVKKSSSFSDSDTVAGRAQGSSGKSKEYIGDASKEQLDHTAATDMTVPADKPHTGGMFSGDGIPPHYQAMIDAGLPVAFVTAWKEQDDIVGNLTEKMRLLEKKYAAVEKYEIRSTAAMELINRGILNGLFDASSPEESDRSSGSEGDA